MDLFVDRLSVGYPGRDVLSNVSLSVGSGELVLLAGANGCGKSTLLNCIVGLIAPRRGQVIIRGEDVGGWSPRAIASLGVSYVPQGGLVFRDLTIRENFQFIAGLRRASRETVTEMWKSDLIRDLTNRAATQASKLSGGERQLLSVALGLIGGPSLVIFDEPTAGLFREKAVSVFRLIRAWTQQHATTFLVVEHDLELVGQFASRVVLLADGEIRSDKDVL